LPHERLAIARRRNDNGAMTLARHLVIHGRVQGVWYRGWAVDTAGALGLAGWVRNRRDGTVEAVVQGDGEAVERFTALAREGPPAASVERIDVSEDEPAALSGFEQRRTL
jgi:acylphosphatase